MLVRDTVSVALPVPAAGEAVGVEESLAWPVGVAEEEAVWLTLAVPAPAAAAEGVGSTVPCGVPLPPPVSCVPVGEEVGEMLAERVTVNTGEMLPVGSALKVLVPVLLSLT